MFQNSQFCYYADDLALYASGESAHEVQEKLQSDMDRLVEWCRINNMKINAAKTKCMVFKSNYCKLDTSSFVINILDEHLETVSTFKYLGVILSEYMTFDQHYEEVCKKMTSRVFMINRYKKLFTAKWRSIFTTSLVVSVLDYCLPIWGNLSDTKTKRINRILLRAARQVVKAKSYNKLGKTEAIEQLNWLLCTERVQIYTLNFIKKYIFNPSLIQNCFLRFERRPEVSRASKMENNFIVPALKNKIARSTFMYRGIMLWNSLPPRLKEIQSTPTFEMEARKWIMDNRNELISSF